MTRAAGSHCDVVIVGVGVSGTYQLLRPREAGVTVMAAAGADVLGEQAAKGYRSLELS